MSMRAVRARIWIGAAAVLALAGGIALALWSSAPREATELLALSLPDASGRQQPLAQWRGKVIVINFWATWCEPCRKEMPEFVLAQREFGPRGLQFVGIAVDQRDKVEQFAKDLDLNYPALIGGYDAVDLSKSLGNELSALPFTIVIDRKGNVARTQLGPFKSDQLRSTITGLL
jgi:thiol-disulfide isomerase/thioredoxin